MKVLHYKSNFLNLSETFIHRVIAHHQQFKAVGMCTTKRSYTECIDVYEKPQTGTASFINTLYFHLNWCLPFYISSIKKANPDVIHAHFGFEGYRMMKPAARLKIPLVVSFYGSDVSRLPTEFDWKRRYRNLAQQGNAFICPSRHMQQQLINLGFPSSKIYIIPFGLDLKTFSFNKNKTDKNSLMMVGRMVEKKGFRFAIQAVDILRRQEKEVRLDLYGDGELRPQLEQLTETLGIGDLVDFYGAVPIEHIMKAHTQHHLLLAPSLTAKDGDEEGMPNTILEAMAMGTAVITTNHAAIGEVVTHQQNGLIVPEGDAKALAKAIADAISPDCNLTEVQKNARKTIEEHFNIQDVVKQTENIYKKVIYNYA